MDCHLVHGVLDDVAGYSLYPLCEYFLFMSHRSPLVSLLFRATIRKGVVVIWNLGLRGGQLAHLQFDLDCSALQLYLAWDNQLYRFTMSIRVGSDAGKVVHA